MAERPPLDLRLVEAFSLGKGVLSRRVAVQTALDEADEAAMSVPWGQILQADGVIPATVAAKIWPHEYLVLAINATREKAYVLPTHYFPLAVQFLGVDLGLPTESLEHLWTVPKYVGFIQATDSPPFDQSKLPRGEAPGFLKLIQTILAQPSSGTKHWLTEFLTEFRSKGNVKPPFTAKITGSDTPFPTTPSI